MRFQDKNNIYLHYALGVENYLFIFAIANITDYYWYQGERIGLVKNNEYVNIIAADNFLKSSSSLFQKLNLQQDQLINISADSKENTKIIRLKLNSISGSSGSDYSKAIDGLKNEAQIICISPYFEREGAEPIGASDVFYKMFYCEYVCVI